MELKYLGDWREVQGELTVFRILNMPRCLEQKHLIEIGCMLKEEGFEPDEFYCHEYPTDGVYVCCKENQEDYFTVSEIKGKLKPTYTTIKMDKNGVNSFECETIKESIQKTEC